MPAGELPRGGLGSAPLLPAAVAARPPLWSVESPFLHDPKWLEWNWEDIKALD